MRYILHVSMMAMFVMWFVLGCGGASTTELTGKVTLDNQPVEHGDIAVFGTDGNHTQAAATITNGGYTFDAKSGLKPGNYKVEIHWLKPTGKTIPSADPGFTMDETREVIPRRYNENTELTITIDTGTNMKDFPLMSK